MVLSADYDYFASCTRIVCVRRSFSLVHGGLLNVVWSCSYPMVERELLLYI